MSKRQQRRAAEIAAEAAALADEAMVVWRVHAWYRRGSVPFYGAPLRCPDCGALSLVLKVDNQKGFCRNRCTECSKVFVITERSMEAVLSGRLPRPEGVVFPGDIALDQDDAPEPAGAVFGALVQPEPEPVVEVAPTPQISWTPPVLQPEPPKAALPPVAWTPPVIDRPEAAPAPPVVAAAPPPPAAAPPPPPVVPAPAPAAPPPPAVAPPPVAPPPPPVQPPSPEVLEPAAAESAGHRPQGVTHAELGRRNRRAAAAARRAKSSAGDDATEDIAADEIVADGPPEAVAPLPPPPVTPPPVAPPSPRTSSSLFSATPPDRPEPMAEEELPVLAPLLQTVAIGGRLVEPTAAPEAPSDRLFGPVLVTTVAGADARLVTPGGGSEPTTAAASPAPPVEAAPPAEPPVPPSASPPPVLPPRGAAPPLTGLPTRERREVLRVLMVEDDPADASLAQAIFDAAGSDTVELRVARSRQSGMAVAAEFEPHVVLLDLDLPDSHGLATITRWCFSDLPGAVVVMSGEYSPVIEQQGREQGVSEFLPKARLTEWLELGEEGVAAAVELVESLAVRQPLP